MLGIIKSLSKKPTRPNRIQLKDRDKTSQAPKKPKLNIEDTQEEIERKSVNFIQKRQKIEQQKLNAVIIKKAQTKFKNETGLIETKARIKNLNNIPFIQKKMNKISETMDFITGKRSICEKRKNDRREFFKKNKGKGAKIKNAKWTLLSHIFCKRR